MNITDQEALREKNRRATAIARAAKEAKRSSVQAEPVPMINEAPPADESVPAAATEPVEEHKERPVFLQPAPADNTVGENHNVHSDQPNSYGNNILSNSFIRKSLLCGAAVGLLWQGYKWYMNWRDEAPKERTTAEASAPIEKDPFEGIAEPAPPPPPTVPKPEEVFRGNFSLPVMLKKD